MSMMTSCTLLSSAAPPAKLPRGALQSGKPAAVALQRKPRSLSVRCAENKKADQLEVLNFLQKELSKKPTDRDHPEEVSMTLQYPMLTRSNYAIWAVKMEVFMRAQGIWEAVERDNADDHKNEKALAAIFQGIPEEILPLLAKKKKAKTAWDMLKIVYIGGDRVEKARAQTPMDDFESLHMTETESIDDFAGRWTTLVNQIRSRDEKVEESYIVKKFLRAIPNKYQHIVSTIEKFVDSNDKLEDVISYFKVCEHLRVPSGDKDQQPQK